MPELAEVEYVARQMRTSVLGARIAQITVAWPRTISVPDVPTFIQLLSGRVIEAIERRAKVLLILLSDDLVLTVHRRMSGNVELLEAGAPPPRYECVRIVLADGRAIVYSDPRKFGRMALYTGVDLPAALADFGPEPLDPEFTDEVLTRILVGTPRAVKALLLDQHAIAGLGNIYADESLHAAGIHPLLPANSLSSTQIAALHAAIIAVLQLGIAHGGTTFGRHRGFYGEVGHNLEHLRVYQRTGEPCRTCGTPIIRIVVAQRGTHLCPNCQPNTHS